MIVNIDGSRITDWASFHDVFAEALGFPGFYGRNMNAWIDCMTSLDDAGAGMTSIHVPPGQVLTLALDHVDDVVKRCPEIYEALVDCTAFVNWRRIDSGRDPVLALSFYKDTRTVKSGSA
ncbi:MAG: barstar family protein [Myxococcales bacterium]|nr:barstar family protein [Myxococcales bacterium]